MVPLFLYLFGVLIALGAAFMAASHDMRAFRIPNAATGLVLVGFCLMTAGLYALPGEGVLFFQGWKTHILSGVVMFLVTLALFAARMIGAGDAKFASALAVWFPLQILPLFIFYVSLVGGVMGLATLAFARLRPFKNPKAGTWIAAAQAGENRIPYGLALSVGFVIVLVGTGYLNITAIINAVENPK